jgi:hypothetical protein
MAEEFAADQVRTSIFDPCRPSALKKPEEK